MGTELVQIGSCGCKGIRSCLMCESDLPADVTSCSTSSSEINDTKVYQYCSVCMCAWEYGKHPDHVGNSIDFPGIYIHEQFITETQEEELYKEIDNTPYVNSQSGRRKQDYGPKVNFKKQKVKCDVFTGLPKYSQSIYEQLISLPVMADFIPVELCNLEYTPERGSAIDPHFDDFWLWGERLVTVSLLSDTVLCFSSDSCPNKEVHVKLSHRSLIIVFGPARHKWKHGIHRSDITDRRIAMTFRELSGEFEDGGKNSSIGQKLKDIALSFSGSPVGVNANKFS